MYYIIDSIFLWVKRYVNDSVLSQHGNNILLFFFFFLINACFKVIHWQHFSRSETLIMTSFCLIKNNIFGSIFLSNVFFWKKCCYISFLCWGERCHSTVIDSNLSQQQNCCPTTFVCFGIFADLMTCLNLFCV